MNTRLSLQAKSINATLTPEQRRKLQAIKFPVEDKMNDQTL